MEELLSIMEETHSDYTNSFLFLEGKAVSEVYLTTSLRYELWLAQKNDFNKIEKENVNPVVIPRNEWVERVLAEAVDNDNWELFQSYIDRLKNPYESQSEDVFSIFNPKNDLSFACAATAQNGCGKFQPTTAPTATQNRISNIYISLLYCK